VDVDNMNITRESKYISSVLFCSWVAFPLVLFKQPSDLLNHASRQQDKVEQKFKAFFKDQYQRKT
jgi:hypothetical protein